MSIDQVIYEAKDLAMRAGFDIETAIARVIVRHAPDYDDPAHCEWMGKHRLFYFEAIEAAKRGAQPQLRAA